MTIRECISRLQTLDPEGGVFVVLMNPDGTSEIFDVHEIGDHQGNAQIVVQEHMPPRL
jgi:hypothetical protein